MLSFGHFQQKYAFLRKPLTVALAAAIFYTLASLTACWLFSDSDFQLKPFLGFTVSTGAIIFLLFYFIFKKLAELGTVFDYAIKATPDAIAILKSEDFSLVELNPLFEKLAMKSRSELVGKSLWEGVDWIDEEQKTEILEILAESDQILNKELIQTLTSGNEFSYLITIAPIYYRDIKCYLVHASDVSIYKEKEKQRSLLQEQLWLAQKYEAIGTLAAGVAHDFKNLLTSIRLGCDNLMQGSSLKDSEKQDLQKVQDVINQAVELSHAMLTFSAEGTSDKEKVELKPFMEEVVESVRYFTKSSVELEFNDYTEKGYYVFINKTLLLQSIINMTNNANDAMPKGGRLTIELDVEQQHALISINDNGVGIDQETAAKIFEPFFTTKVSEKAGTGLGLSVAYGIIKAHDGSIDVESEPDDGTTLTIILPILSEKDSLDIDTNVISAVGDGETVLIVEVEKWSGGLISSFLNRAGYKAVVKGVEEALSMFSGQNNQIDLVLLDLAEGLNNLHPLLKAAESSKVPVLLIASSGDTLPTNAGIIPLMKPFQLPELTQAINESIKRHD